MQFSDRLRAKIVATCRIEEAALDTCPADPSHSGCLTCLARLRFFDIHEEANVMLEQSMQ